MPVLRPLGAQRFVLIACFVAATVAVPAQRFKSPSYSVTPPTGWRETTQNMSKGVVAFLGPDEQNFTVNISVLSEPAPHETLAQYVEAMHRQSAAHKEMTRLKDGKTILAGRQAHTMLSDLRLGNRTDLPALRSYQVYAMHKDRAYILTLTYPKSVAETAAKKYTAAFDKMAASFKWEK